MRIRLGAIAGGSSALSASCPAGPFKTATVAYRRTHGRKPGPLHPLSGFKGIAFQRKAKICRCLTDTHYRALKKLYPSASIGILLEAVVTSKSETVARASHLVQPVNVQLKTVRVWQRRSGASGKSLKLSHRGLALRS